MKFKNLIFAITACLFLVNCSNSGGDDLSGIPDPTGTVTFNGSVKAIIDNNCIVCHGDPTTQGAPMSLTTYTEVKSALETRNLIDRINSASNPMPQNGLMTQANRDLIQQWKDDGLLEN